jgi:hypothetical protein
MKGPVVFKLQLHKHENSFYAHATTGRGAETGLVALTGEDALALGQLGEQLSAGHLCTREEVDQAGEEIFSKVFRDRILEIFLQACEEANLQDRWLRILISAPQGTGLHEIPWEILRRDGKLLSCSMMSIVRCLPLPTPTASLASAPPIHMLLSTAELQGQNHLKLDAEVEAVCQSVAETQGRILLTIQRNISRESLVDLFQDARRSGDPIRIWHHSGHGRVQARKFSLTLEDQGEIQDVEASSLAQLLAAEGDLKLTVLSLCFGGETLGLGTHLASLNVPAVVGFRGAIVNPAAIRFSKSFYKDLASVPVDVAVARARGTLSVDDILDWTQPVLYARDIALSLWSTRVRQPEPSPKGSHGTTFRNEGIRVRENTVQIGQAFGGRESQASTSARPIEFLNKDLETEKLVQVGQIDLESRDASTFAKRWIDLLDFVSGSER